LKTSAAPISRTTTQSLLALAAILITNSHLEPFYPSPLFAGDGLLGNSIFFMVAGLGVTLSALARRRLFIEYYWRRIIRIYPTVIIVVTVFILGLGGKWREWGWREYLATYLFPTPWAFVAHIMVYYVVLYPFLRAPSKRLFTVMLLLLAAAFAWIWIEHAPNGPRLVLGLLYPPVYYVFWFAMVVLGAWLAIGRNRFAISLKGQVAIFLLTFAIYLGLKVLFVTGRAAHFQFLLFVIDAVLVWLLAQIALSESVIAWIDRQRLLRNGIEWIGGLTLEIYTIQVFLSSRPELSHNIPFPLNIAAFWVLLLLAAWLVKAVVSRIQRQSPSRPAVA
jgi:peptidoglycan/LPS O-acetylase OafA/YrhL